MQNSVRSGELNQPIEIIMPPTTPDSTGAINLGASKATPGVMPTGWTSYSRELAAVGPTFAREAIKGGETTGMTDTRVVIRWRPGRLPDRTMRVLHNPSGWDTPDTTSKTYEIADALHTEDSREEIALQCREIR